MDFFNHLSYVIKNILVYQNVFDSKAFAKKVLSWLRLDFFPTIMLQGFSWAFLII